jgi:hypothetical protein
MPLRQYNFWCYLWRSNLVWYPLGHEGYKYNISILFCSFAHQSILIWFQAKATLEKTKASLEGELADLASELKTATSAKTDLERRRKQAEAQLSK